MTVVAVVLQIAWLVAIYAAVAVAFLATKPSRHWFIAPCAAPMLVAVGFALAGVDFTPAVSVLAGLGFVLLGTIGGSPFVTLVLALATRGSVTLGSHGGILVMSPAPVREILRGGATIGYLERFALIGSTLVGQPAAVAVIVAVKGLGRYSELENAAARERFIIGTLASLVWAGLATAAIVLSW